MKKRITCMLLALCMVLAAVPAAVAAPVVEDQIDVSLLEKQLGNESQLLQAEVVQKLQKDAAEPMDAEASGDAEIFPHTSCVNQYRLIGDKIHLEGFAYVPETAVGQEWNIALFAGAKLTEDGYLGGWYNYFDDGAGLYSFYAEVDTAKIGTGTFTVLYYISDGEEPIQDTMYVCNVYVTNKMSLMTRSFFADGSREGSPRSEEDMHCPRSDPD